MEHWHYKHIEYRECEPCDSNRLVSALQHEESFEVTREKEHDGKVNEDAERKLHPGVGTFFGLVLGQGEKRAKRPYFMRFTFSSSEPRPRARSAIGRGRVEKPQV